MVTFKIHFQGDLLSKIERDPEYHDRFLLEVLRLWPPFFGGRRLVNEDIECQGYRIPKGYTILYSTTAAQRDPEAFDNPDAFDPTRWRDK
jgi:cytochrome P450